LSSQSVSKSVNQLVCQSVSQLINRSIQLVNSTSQSVSQSGSQSGHQSARLSITDAGCISHKVDCMSDLIPTVSFTSFYPPCKNQIIKSLNKVPNTVLTKSKILK